MDVAVKEALLKDPRVQELLWSDGVEGLRRPEVQGKIVAICQERFPDDADYTKNTVATWADDEEVVLKVHNAKLPIGAAALVGWWRSSVAMVSTKAATLIESGPAGVKTLAFFGGLVSAVLAIAYMTNLVFDLEYPTDFVVGVYQLAFGVVTMLVEASPDTLARVGAKELQDFVSRQAPCLRSYFGSGVFVAWQGVWWIHEDFGQVFVTITGFYLCAIGSLLALMHFGVAPEHVTASLRRTTRWAWGSARVVYLSMASGDAEERDRQTGGGALAASRSDNAIAARGDVELSTLSPGARSAEVLARSTPAVAAKSDAAGVGAGASAGGAAGTNASIAAGPATRQSSAGQREGGDDTFEPQ